MSESGHDSDLLTTELLQKYRDGTLSPDEAAHLDILRTQDPFVADALAGVARVDSTTFGADVAELRQRIRQRARPHRRRVAWALPAAASLVLLSVASYLVYTYVSAPPSLVQEAMDASRTSEKPPSLPRLSALPSTALADSPRFAARRNPPALVAAQPAPVPTPSSTVEPNPIEPLNGLALREADAPHEALPRKAPASAAKTRSGATEALPAPARSRPLASSVAAAVGERVITGRVIDQSQEEPIPGANVLVKGTTMGAVTDIEGRFALSVPTESDFLMFSSIGYVTQEIPLGQRDSAYVALKPDVQSLSEVVVVGYGTAERAERAGVTTNARPSTGMRQFKKYLLNNLRYPSDWIEGNKEVVRLSFLVQADGTLTDFTVKKSAGRWLDQEAIRAIKEGPRWVAATHDEVATPRRVNVRVRFKK